MRSLLLGVTALAITSAAFASLIADAVGQETRPAAKVAPKQTSKATVSFADDVFPIFKGRCMECHQPGAAGYEKSGLDLRTHEGLMKGTKFGPMVIAGDPNFSSLMRLLDWRTAPEIRMPHGSKKLSVCDRDAIRRWISEGALNN